MLYDANNKARYLSKDTSIECKKIGSTCDMKTMMKQYIIIHPDKVPVECYYQIKNPEKYSCYEIDNMIKDKFNEYRLKGSGSSDFYDVKYVTQEVIETYFDNMGIEWEKLYEIMNDNVHTFTDEDVANFTHDMIQRNKLMKNIL